VAEHDRATACTAPAAQPIFWYAITTLRIQEARHILRGGHAVATEYFKATRTGALIAVCRPVLAWTMHAAATAKRAHVPAS
jgi:Protein of unknown function (DUF4197)